MGCFSWAALSCVALLLFCCSSQVCRISYEYWYTFSLSTMFCLLFVLNYVSCGLFGFSRLLVIAASAMPCLSCVATYGSVWFVCPASVSSSLAWTARPSLKLSIWACWSRCVAPSLFRRIAVLPARGPTFPAGACQGAHEHLDRGDPRLDQADMRDPSTCLLHLPATRRKTTLNQRNAGSVGRLRERFFFSEGARGHE